MTDNEIIEALEYCCHNGHCKNCPHSCADNKNIEDLALDLINRQKEEIERLKGWQDLLKAEKHSLIKAEAIKGFASKLIEKLSIIPQHHFTFLDVEYVIDNLVKEMVGEQNG